MKKIYYLILIFCLSLTAESIAQRTYKISKNLEKLNLISKKSTLESTKQDTNFFYGRLSILEDIKKYSFDKYDTYYQDNQYIIELQAKKAKGKTLEKRELAALETTKIHQLKDTCIWLNQYLFREGVISQNTKKEVEKLLHKGVTNPADILNAMHYYGAKEYLNSPKNLSLIVEEFYKNQWIKDSLRNHLLQEIKSNPKFEHQKIYQAYSQFRYLKVPPIKTTRELENYLGNFINSLLGEEKITDYQIVTKIDSIFDNVYDEERDTSVWGLYETNENNFFTFKLKNIAYKYPIDFYRNEEDSLYNTQSLLQSNAMTTILLQITTDAKLPYHSIVFDVAEDIEDIMHHENTSYLKRIFPIAKLEQLAVWNLPKKGKIAFGFGFQTAV
jgi:hypothetical protein